MRLRRSNDPWCERRFGGFGCRVEGRDERACFRSALFIVLHGRIIARAMTSRGASLRDTHYGIASSLVVEILAIVVTLMETGMADLVMIVAISGFVC